MRLTPPGYPHRRVPLGYIFESNIVEVLLRLFPQPPFRNVTLQCLAEVGGWGCAGLAAAVLEGVGWGIM